jgi:hypothetical protein
MTVGDEVQGLEAVDHPPFRGDIPLGPDSGVVPDHNRTQALGECYTLGRRLAIGWLLRSGPTNYPSPASGRSKPRMRAANGTCITKVG